MYKTSYGQVFTQEEFEEMFPVIDPRELIGHKLLKHKPKTMRQEILLVYIQKGIELNLPAFRASCMDPSEENGKIIFKLDNKPAVGHSPVWWKETWKIFMPSKNSRSGTELHWAAFLGKQMKYLIEEKKYSVKNAWKAVCDGSYYRKHYWNRKKEQDFEAQNVGLFRNLSNNRKILEKWEASGFWFAGDGYSCDNPLANLVSIFYSDFDYFDSVGWLVMDI